MQAKSEYILPVNEWWVLNCGILFCPRSDLFSLLNLLQISRVAISCFYHLILHNFQSQGFQRIESFTSIKFYYVSLLLFASSLAPLPKDAKVSKEDEEEEEEDEVNT